MNKIIIDGIEFDSRETEDGVLVIRGTWREVHSICSVLTEHLIEDDSGKTLAHWMQFNVRPHRRGVEAWIRYVADLQPSRRFEAMTSVVKKNKERPMITEEQFKRAKNLTADRDELQKFVDGFSNQHVKNTMGLCGDYGGTGISNNDKVKRFNHIKKDMIARINEVVINELRSDIEKLNLQIAEHVIADEVPK